MATKFNFTKKTLETIIPPAKGRDIYSDTQQPGLRLRVTTTGAKTFTLIKKAGGKTQFITLGTFPETTIPEARAKAGEEAARLARGESPSKKQPDKLTFEELFTRYLNGYARHHKRTWQEDEKNFHRYLTGLARKPVSEITRDTITRLHSKMGDNNGRYIANRVLALLKTVFNYGEITLGLKVQNPAKGVRLYREQSRERFLNGDELRRFFDALNHGETPQDWQDFFSLALFTGARRGNVQSMNWQHIDLQAGLWKIPADQFKNGDAFTVVLTEPALQILTRRKNERGKSHFVFPSGSSKAGHVVEPKKVWKGILDRAGLEDVRLHDLRRTLGSWQAATGASLQVIGKTLGHRNQATTAIYARLNLDPVKSAMDTATAAMLDAIK